MLKKISHWTKQFIEDPEYKLCQIAMRFISQDKLPDRMVIKYQFHCAFGYSLNLRHPKTFNEKLNWLKLHDHNPLYTTLVDKYRVKQWVADKIGEQYVIPTLAVYNSVDEIDLDKLPNQFVLKCNHDSGSVFICKDKSSLLFVDKYMNTLSFKEVLNNLNIGLQHNFYIKHREWPYKNVKPLIIVEKLMLSNEEMLPTDYKLFFINDDFQFVYVSVDREGANDRCIFDKDWNRLPFVYVDHYRDNMNTTKVACPSAWKEMLQIGQRLAEPFQLVRIDLYEINGEVYFGEVTPYHSAGYAKFYPEKYDVKYGQKLKLK